MKFSRRDLSVALGFAAVAAPFGSVVSQGNNSYSSQRLADEWVRSAIGLGAVAGGVHVMRFSDPYYAVTRRIGWKSDTPRDGLNVVDVPVGFVTDFASIPRVFWSILPRDGKYTFAAVIHDYLYWEQTTSREDSDDIFRAAMAEFGVSRPAIASIHSAVRAGGGFAWEGNARAKSRGERRVVRNLPDDPKMSWAQWRLTDAAYR